MEPEKAPPNRWRRFRRRAFLWVTAWLLFSALGSWRHNERWIDGHINDAWTLVDGVLQVAVLPVWFVLKVVFGYETAYSLGFAVLANAAGFALIALGFIVFRFLSKWFSRWLMAKSPEGVDRRRRYALIGSVPEAVLAVGAGSMAYATIVEPWQLHVDRRDVPIADLPNELDGVRVLQLTDTHRGPRITASFIERAVETGLRQKPDLVVLTGDYVHNGPTHIDEAAEIMRPLADAVPTVGVLGNHDWYAGAYKMRRALENAGVRMIDNGRCYFGRQRTLTDREEGLCIAGVGDLLESKVDYRRALGGVDPDMPRLLLSHNPDAAEMREAGDHRIDLMLSGHTHGGQVRLPIIGSPGVPSRFGEKYRAGMVQGPWCRVFISTGVGMSVAPFRFGVRPEINVLTLRRV